MNDTNIQHFNEPLFEEARHLQVLWDEGTSFSVAIQRKSKVNTGLHMDLFTRAEMFQFDRRRHGSYAEFLKHAS